MEPGLSNFAYKTSIGISTFIVAGISAMHIARLTVSYQSFEAAIVDPVDLPGAE